MNNRVDQLRGKLKESNLDSVIISAPENRRYLSGFSGSAGYLLISQSATLIATDFRYFEQVKQQCQDFQLVEIWGELQGWLPDALNKLDAQRVGVEGANLTVNLFKQMTEVVSKMEGALKPQLIPTTDLVEGLRMTKDAKEMESLSCAIAIADEAFQEVSAKLKPGMTEKQVAWELEKRMREKGADSVSFDTIVASGPNGALPHHQSTDRPIQKGEPIIIDMGAKYDGYCSDMTRTVYLGKPDDIFKKVYDTVLAAQLTAIATVQPGMTGEAVDKLARTVIEQAGYGDKFGHGLGHGVGLEIHEAPRVSRNSTNVIKEGMPFTVEPGIYLPGWGGVRIEDVIVLEEGKARVLTSSPKVGV